MYIVVGLASGGRVCIGTTYMNELIPTQNQALATTCINLMDASNMIIQSIYYIFVKDWYYIHLFGLFFAVFIILNVCVLPESPKDMYANYKFDRARKYLKAIARWNAVFNNKVDPELVDTITFDTEVMDQKKKSLASQVAPDNEEVYAEGERSDDEEVIEEGAIKLTGEFKEIWEIPEIRTNSIVMLGLISISSFCYFLINFSMKKIKGSLIKNTLTS